MSFTSRIWWLRVQNLQQDGFKFTNTSKLCSRQFTDNRFTIDPWATEKYGYKKVWCSSYQIWFFPSRWGKTKELNSFLQTANIRDVFLFLYFFRYSGTCTIYICIFGFNLFEVNISNVHILVYVYKVSNKFQCIRALYWENVKISIKWFLDT